MGESDLETYLREHPLTEAERRLGRALRLVCCDRSDEGIFEDGPVSHLWVVISCARAPRLPAHPRCLALDGTHGMPREVRAVASVLLARHRFEDGEGAPWSADEYSFCVADRFPRFLVLAGRLKVAAGDLTHRCFLEEYDRRIANASVDSRYPEWLERRRAALLTLPVPAPGPLMSIVTPAYRTPTRLLREMLQSVLAQTYRRWELVLVNASPDDEGMRAVLAECADPRIHVVELAENRGIVGNTNYGIARCTGDYVSFFDHDDVVEPCALAELVRVICQKSGDVGLLYCDEDNIDEDGRPSLPLIKPSLNPDFLLSNNYVIHWLTVRRDLLSHVELSGPDVEGAQDYDLTLKVVETGAPVVRVSQVLYHWRICAGSSAGDPASKSYAQDAGARAIEGHLARTGAAGEVARGRAYFTYRTIFSVRDPAPGIAVRCSGDVHHQTRVALDGYAADHGAVVRFGEGAGDVDLALHITPEHVLDFDSLELMVGQACQPGVFSVAPRVVRADGLLDYAGMVIRPDGSLGHLLRYLPQEDGGYVGRAQRPYDAAVVNPECCLVNERACTRLALEGGFSTPAYALTEAFLRAQASGQRNVFLPYATARLSAPRSLLGPIPSGEERADAARLAALFPWVAQGDPTHSSGFDPWNGYYRLNWA